MKQTQEETKFKKENKEECDICGEVLTNEELEIYERVSDTSDEICYDKERLREGEARYLCIGACYPTYKKITTKLSEVTCQNCLRKIYEK